MDRNVVQAIDDHAALTTTAHGLGASAFHAEGYYPATDALLTAMTVKTRDEFDALTPVSTTLYIVLPNP